MYYLVLSSSKFSEFMHYVISYCSKFSQLRYYLISSCSKFSQLCILSFNLPVSSHDISNTKDHPQFPGLVLLSDRKLTLVLLATITFKVVGLRVYAPFPTLVPFLNASWKSCSARVFCTAFDSASITLVVSIRQHLVLSSIG
jgi:hypothetical protein